MNLHLNDCRTFSKIPLHFLMVFHKKRDQAELNQEIEQASGKVHCVQSIGFFSKNSRKRRVLGTTYSQPKITKLCIV